LNNETTIVKIAIDKLIPNKYQPRKYFDDTSLNELANSIKNYGIINPILVRQKEDKYEIIAGERRFRAAKLIGLNEVPVIVKNTDEQQMAELALIENLARQDLTAIEAARAYEEIIKIGNHTQSEIAARLGKSQATIANKLRLLSLPIEVQDAILNKKISERHARCLLNIKDKTKQIEILNRIISDKLTVKETEELVSIQNINEEDIKQAINDIMKSLNIKEEEKEDEKMNNGNFFPNYDNNMGQNNNISLNSLNSMNQVPPNMASPMSAEPEFVMPTMGQPRELPPQEIPNQNPNMNNFVSQPTIPNNEELLFTQPQPSPMMDPPLFNQNLNQIPNEIIPNNDFQNINQPTNFPNVEPMSFSQTQEMVPPIPPLFEQNISSSMAPLEQANNMAFEPQPSMMTPTQPIIQEAVTEPIYEEPAVVSPTVEQISQPNKLAEVEMLLNNNGIAYKTYSNDQGHCIIIEL